MLVYLWDEICDEWSHHELEIEETMDPAVINQALNRHFKDEDESQEEWSMKSHSITGPILTIESRSSRGHLSVIIAISHSETARWRSET